MIINLTVKMDVPRASSTIALLKAAEELGVVTHFEVSEENLFSIRSYGSAIGGGVALAQQSTQNEVQAAVPAVAQEPVAAPAARRGRPPAAKPESAPAPEAQQASAPEPAPAPSPTASAASAPTPASSGDSGNVSSDAGAAAPAASEAGGAQPAAQTGSSETLTVAMVRAVLSPLAQSGKRKEVNQIITKFGRTLEDIRDDQAKLAEAYKLAKELAAQHAAEKK